MGKGARECAGKESRKRELMAQGGSVEEGGGGVGGRSGRIWVCAQDHEKIRTREAVESLQLIFMVLRANLGMRGRDPDDAAEVGGAGDEADVTQDHVVHLPPRHTHARTRTHAFAQARTHARARALRRRIAQSSKFCQGREPFNRCASSPPRPESSPSDRLSAASAPPPSLPPFSIGSRRRLTTTL